MAIVQVRKVGNSMCITFPAALCRRNGIKNGELFKIENDVLLPDRYTLIRLNDNTNNF